MRRHLLPLGLAALFINPSLAPAAPLDLSAALETAIRANPELAAARRELQALEATVVQAQARPNPELAMQFEDTRSATRSTALQLNQPIELGGKRAARIDAAERGRDAAAAELRGKLAEVRAAVTVAFFDTLVAQERLRLARDAVELAQRATEVARRRVLAGKVSPIEETRARVAESGVRVELRTAESELASARTRLAGTWGDASPRFESVDGDPGALPQLPPPAELERRIDSSPRIARARIEVERRLALVEVERSRRVPNVTVSLGAKRNNELGRDQAILGVSIPIPLFDRNDGNLLEALRRADKARDNLSATEVRLSTEMMQALGRLAAARDEMASLERDILPGARHAYDAALKGFELGKFGFLEVLDAQRTLFQAKSQSLRAFADAQRAAAEIERLAGAVPQEPASTPARQ